MLQIILLANLLFFSNVLIINANQVLAADIEAVNLNAEPNAESNNIYDNNIESTNTENTNENPPKLIKVDSSDDDSLLEKELIEAEERKKLDKENYYKILRDSSIFHTQEELDRLDNALEALEEGREVIVDTPDIEETDTKVETIKTTNIVFYLDSIMYHTKDDWVIWLNGNKITPELNKTDLEILQINRSMVKFRWITGYKKFVSTIVKSIEDGSVPEQASVEISDDIAKIDFQLEPNQSLFISNYLEIKEGKN